MREKKKFNVKRRDAMKKSLQGAIATGAVTTASTWKKPVVEAVMLPAHAQTSQLTISINNLTVIGGDGGDSPLVTLSVDNPVNGTNVGTITGGYDYGNFELTGVINPLPPAGTNVSLSVNESANIADTSFSPCVLSPGATYCPTTSLPVNNTNGDFSLAATNIEGLDDGSNVYTVTLSVLGAPDTVVRFNVEP